MLRPALPAQAAYPSVYYESIAGSELVAASLANPVHGIGVRAGNVTNIALAGGKVYFQDGVNIYAANPDLSGISLFHTNGVSITDLAVDAVNGIYYESIAGSELVAASLANPVLPRDEGRGASQDDTTAGQAWPISTGRPSDGIPQRTVAV